MDIFTLPSVHMIGWGWVCAPLVRLDLNRLCPVFIGGFVVALVFLTYLSHAKVGESSLQLSWDSEYRTILFL